jgi:hypothetical protein
MLTIRMRLNDDLSEVIKELSDKLYKAEQSPTAAPPEGKDRSIANLRREFDGKLEAEIERLRGDFLTRLDRLVTKFESRPGWKHL